MKEFEHLRVPLDFIKHATNNFGATNFIAEGGFGKVYKGEFQGEVFFHSHGRNIGAVKILDRSKDQADVSFWREIMLLSSYRHENLISLLGFCDERDKRIIVYEYASNKSLDFHLCSPDLTWLQRLKICLGAACGLQYLHDPRGTQQRVLHRDIKSANILLDENWNAKIADFGLSKHGPANQQYTFLFSEAKGTLGYCDPMYLETMLLTKESDVYSFGVVLFEVLCSRHCVDYSYNDERRSLPVLVKKCYREKSLHTIIDVNLKQQIKEKSLDTFVTLAYQCLERDRTQRPSMEMVVSMLESALKHQVNYSFSSSENEIRGGAIGNVTTTESHSYGKRTFPWNFLNFAGGQSSHGTGKGRGHQGSVKFGFNLAKGKANHPMEDYHVAKFIPYQGRELGLFAIYDGHLGDSVPVYLQKHLFSNILKEGEFWTDPSRAILKAYERTDQSILSHSPDLGRGGSTAVTALLIDGHKLWIANVGDSRAVLSKRGKAIQMSVDHEPNTERGSIENRGGFVSNMPGDVARVNGQLAVSRAFGDKNLKSHLRSDPDVTNADIDATTEILILASDGLWKVMSNQEAVDIAIKIKDPLKGAKELVAEALRRESKDDISCIVVRF